jgi:tRNA dimethylallyltransferase
VSEHERPAPALLVLVGPTGSGKSALALKLSVELDCEIIGCDALQVYRGFDAATAKPSIEERRQVPHHLIDCVDPVVDFSLADYVRLAEAAIAEIAERRRVPFVVGGTGMYLRGLLRGVISAPPRDAALRDRLREIVRRGGGDRLRAWLERMDPDSARRIPPGDLQRTLRAIELGYSPGKNWSERLRGGGTWEGDRERYPTLKIGLASSDPDGAAKRLDARVDAFFDAGLVEEVRTLLHENLPPTANAFKAIGYREVLAALLRGEDALMVRDEVKRKTRRYAKRQRTWFRREPGLTWLDADAEARWLVARIIDLWRDFSHEVVSSRRREPR